MSRLFSLIVFAVLVLGVGVLVRASVPDSGADGDPCIQRNRDVAAQLAADLARNAICKSNSDCEILPIGECPLGCWTAVAKKNARTMKALISESVQRLDPTCKCMYRCVAPPLRASCSKKKCIISKAR
jgi:hypothetical protein